MAIRLRQHTAGLGRGVFCDDHDREHLGRTGAGEQLSMLRPKDGRHIQQTVEYPHSAAALVALVLRRWMSDVAGNADASQHHGRDVWQLFQGRSEPRVLARGEPCPKEREPHRAGSILPNQEDAAAFEVAYRPPRALPWYRRAGATDRGAGVGR